MFLSCTIPYKERPVIVERLRDFTSVINTRWLLRYAPRFHEKNSKKNSKKKIQKKIPKKFQIENQN
jgi:hypothetical protein